MSTLLRIFTTVIGGVAVLTGAAGVFFGAGSPLFATVQGEHVVVLDNMIRGKTAPEAVLLPAQA